MQAFSQSISEALAGVGDESGTDSGSDIFLIVVFSLVVLFFLWLVVAAVRKKLASSKARIGEFKEDEQEAARTARLWSEAKRKAEKEKEEEEEEEKETEALEKEEGAIQAELLEKARQRREARREAEEQAPEPEEKPPPEKEIAKEEEETQPEPAAVAEEAIAEELAEPAEKKPPPAARPRSLEEGLTKTRSGFVSRLGKMFRKTALDEDDIEEIEEILFTADIGVRTSQKLIDVLQNETESKNRTDPGRLQEVLKERIEKILAVDAKPVDTESNKPFVILVVGVNGTGKTTTIGKLAMRYRREGKKVILAAADTFRAAATEQLQIWGERSGAQVIAGKEGTDPGAVVFDAISAAKSQSADIVIADTAGRLHTKINLVEELKKVQRVCGKAFESAPHEVFLVLDATTGQNAINQAKQFHKALYISGVILTKLDGTAKGGIIIGVCDTFGIPVRYIGIGEQVDDLRPFDPAAFVTALFD